jgi:phospholipase C
MHLFTGSNGLSVGKPAVIDNTEPAAGYEWITMGEILEEAGVSWKVYQEAGATGVFWPRRMLD